MLETATLAILIGFGLVALSLTRREYSFLAGLVWVFSAVSVFPEYGAGWVVISLGFGMMLMVGGYFDYQKEKKEASE